MLPNSSATRQRPGLVQVHPHIDFSTFCPVTESEARPVDWAVSGQWTLARLKCGKTGREFWSDLPYGVGLLAPCWIDASTGSVVRPGGAGWYAGVTDHGWNHPSGKVLTVTAHVRRPARNLCLVNCVHAHFGDALSLLLRVAALRSSGLDIVVITTRNLLWLVPDYVAEVWTVEGSHRDTAYWNQSLADAIRARVVDRESCWIPSSFQPASIERGQIGEFARVPPFPVADWDRRLASGPVVTFNWRPDRCWAPDPADGPMESWGFAGRQPFRHLRGLWRSRAARKATPIQAARIGLLAARLREFMPTMDFAVIGPGRTVPLPAGVADLRSDTFDDAVERSWAERAARSHVLVGVHGSHMVLPSALSGSVVELMPRDRLPSILQDLVVEEGSSRDGICSCRFLPMDASVRWVTDVVVSLLCLFPLTRIAYHRDHAGLQLPAEIEEKRRLLAERRLMLKRLCTGSVDPYVGP